MNTTISIRACSALKFDALKNHLPKHFLIIASIFVGAMSFYSCSEPIIADTSLLIDEDAINARLVDTSTVIARTVSEDPLRTDELDIGSLGNMNDPDFGITKSALYTQLRLTTNNVDLGSGLVCDKLVLRLVYAGSYGPLTQPIDILVQEMNEEMDDQDDYRSDETFDVLSAIIGSATGMVPNTSDSIEIDGVLSPPQLVIELDKSLGDRLLAQSGTPNMANDSAFQAFFNGLFISVSDATVSDGLVYLNLSHPQTKLTLHYSNDSLNDQTFDFQIDENTARANQYSHTYEPGQGIYQDYLISQYLDVDSKFGADQMFLKPLAGSKGYIQFPFLDRLSDVAVNKAELVLTVIRDENGNDLEYDPPSRLFLWRINDDGEQTLLLDFLDEPAGNLGGAIESAMINGTETFQYRFIITRYAQQIINGEFDNNGLYLTVFNDNIIGNRVILGGGNHSEFPIRLKLMYTNLK